MHIPLKNILIMMMLMWHLSEKRAKWNNKKREKNDFFISLELRTFCYRDRCSKSVGLWGTSSLHVITNFILMGHNIDWFVILFYFWATESLAHNALMICKKRVLGHWLRKIDIYRLFVQKKRMKQMSLHYN
jgi:hypothetical protein